MKKLCSIFAAITCGLGSWGLATAAGSEAPEPVRGQYRGVLTVAKFDVSPSLRSMVIPVPSGPLLKGGGHTIDPMSGLEWLNAASAQGQDLIVQPQVGLGGIPGPIVSFNAQPNISGVNPPDSVGDVGPNHYVAMSNLATQVFDKSGNSVFGPVATNTLWAGFGGACQTENSGDPVILHDQFADRWIVTQFTSAGPTYFNCVAISQTADPAGSYYRYAITTGSNFPDYPKYGVWSNAYVISTREFAGNSFAGVGAYAINRAQMIAGNPAPQVISFIVPPGTQAYNVGDGLLPADIDGSTLPPVNAPSYFVGSMDSGGPYGAPQDALTLWKFVINFTTPANSSFTLANTIPIANYDTIYPCASGRSCIPQPGTATGVDIQSYRQRPLHRLAYRNFGTHESLVTNQSVEAATAMAGIRWWELRSPNTMPVLFQEGTYAPGVTDGVHRWMGSIAQDSSGNMALGFSASSSTVFPSLRYTGRLVSDPPGQMPQGEGIIINGTGSNTGGGSRWGDYTSMNIDPTDDCTFWYVGQYTPVTSDSGWRLRVGSFRFNECGEPGFTLSAAPQTATMCAPSAVDYTVNVGSISGFTNPVTLSNGALPPGISAGFGTNPVMPVGTSLVTFTASGATVAGTYTVDINGVSGALNRSAPVELVVQTVVPSVASLTAPANAATGVNTSPVLAWNAVVGANSYLVEVATDAGFSNIVRSQTVTTNTYSVTPSLGTSTEYFWRVTANNACGAATASSVFSFTTNAQICFVGSVTITDGLPAGINNTLAGSAGLLTDMNVKLVATHSYVGDVKATLTHSGTTVILMDRPGYTGTGFGCSGDNINAIFDDAGTGPAEPLCATPAPAIGGILTPVNPLSVFNAQTFAGDWVLNISDSAGGDIGNLLEWCLLPTFEAPNPDIMFANGFE